MVLLSTWETTEQPKIMAVNYNSQTTEEPTNMAAKDYNIQLSHSTFSFILIAPIWIQLHNHSHST